jgi:hypothetical protein
VRRRARGRDKSEGRARTGRGATPPSCSSHPLTLPPTPNPPTSFPPDIFSQCVLDDMYTSGKRYPRPPTFLIGADQFPDAAGCASKGRVPFLRSMVRPTDDGSSWGCYHPDIDKSFVSGRRPSFSLRLSGLATHAGSRFFPSTLLLTHGRPPVRFPSFPPPHQPTGERVLSYQVVERVGVHSSSGVPNRAFFLMAQGLGGGVGRGKDAYTYACPAELAAVGLAASDFDKPLGGWRFCGGGG